MTVGMSSFWLRRVLILALFTCLTHCDESDRMFGEKFVFSDKTAYHFVNKPISRPKKYDPVYINMVIRHGSRYPSKSRVEAMSRILRRLNSFFPVNKTDNTTFRYKGLSLPWNIPADVKNSASKELSRLGAQEMYWIAQRMRARFPELFKHGYSNTKYSFTASDKLRSSQSAVAFAQGIFEQQGSVGLSKFQPVAVKVSGPAGEDRVLRVHEACPKWKKMNAKSSGEYAKFIHGPYVQNVTENLYSRLNLKNKTKLTFKIVFEMFLMCAFGTQTDSNDVSLCSVFEDEDLNVLEYLNDLKIYWSYGYGRKINYRMACPLYMEITKSFQQYIRDGKPYGMFQFGHTGTVLPLLTLLGLYKDDLPLRADNFDKQTNRTFRPSNIVPMSANIAFVLYERKKNDTNHSQGTTAKRKVSTMMIQMLVNEVAVEMPACEGKTYCRLKKFLDYYAYIRKTCNINRICGRLRGNCQKSRKKAGKRGAN